MKKRHKLVQKSHKNVNLGDQKLQTSGKIINLSDKKLQTGEKL